VNLAVLALLYVGAGLPAVAASAAAIEASVVFSFGWRRMWGVALGRRKGNVLSALAATHAWGIPSSALTFGSFVALTRTGVHPVAAQAMGIVPAMVWNYFIGDRIFSIPRRRKILDGGGGRGVRDEAHDAL
jgi:putative flippase GtrA